jgi:hypothetical protein
MARRRDECGQVVGGGGAVGKDGGPGKGRRCLTWQSLEKSRGFVFILETFCGLMEWLNADRLVTVGTRSND